jgi:hypothetical protein
MSAQHGSRAYLLRDEARLHAGIDAAAIRACRRHHTVNSLQKGSTDKFFALSHEQRACETCEHSQGRGRCESSESSDGKAGTRADEDASRSACAQACTAAYTAFDQALVRT